MPHPDNFAIGNAEIKARNLKVAALSQLAKPLVRYMEAASRRHGENASGMIVLLAHVRDSVAQDCIDVFLRRKVDKGHDADVGYRL